MNKPFFSPSKLTVYLVFAIILYSLFNIKPWKNAEGKNNLINWDVTSYYGYLPAVFVHKDLSLGFLETDTIDYKAKHQFWPETAPNGGKVIKTTMGMSFLYAPFFFIAHGYASLSDQYQANGFSMPYEFLLTLSSLFYLIIGIQFLRKILLRSFNEWITSITILCVLFGTNLYYYSTSEPCYSHAYSFSLIAVFIYFVLKWHENQFLKYAVFLGITGGLLVLIRPVNLLIFLFPFLLQVNKPKDLFVKVRLFATNWKHLLTIAILSFIIIAPQFCYWKFITGSWLFNSYIGEHFYFNDPHVLEFLFSYRKGWLLYTPIMIFSILGIAMSYKYNRYFFNGLLFFILINIYVLSSWWCWWYGGSFGMRPMIDCYAILAIPFAVFLCWIFEKHILIKYITGLVLIGFISLNLFQTAQKRNLVLHWDSMTKDAYWHNILKLRIKTQKEWTEFESKLQTPDYDKARKGEEEYVFDPF